MAAAKAFDKNILAYEHLIKKAKKEKKETPSGSPDNLSKKLGAALRLSNQLALHQVYIYTLLTRRILTVVRRVETLGWRICALGGSKTSPAA